MEKISDAGKKVGGSSDGECRLRLVFGEERGGGDVGSGGEEVEGAFDDCTSHDVQDHFLLLGSLPLCLLDVCVPVR